MLPQSNTWEIWNVQTVQTSFLWPRISCTVQGQSNQPQNSNSSKDLTDPVLTTPWSRLEQEDRPQRSNQSRSNQNNWKRSGVSQLDLMMGETIWKAANRELLVQSSSIGDKPAWLRNGPHHSYSCVAIQMPLSWGLEQLCNEYRSKASCTIWVKISKILESSWDESRQHDLRVQLRLVSFPCAIDQKVPWIAETFTNHLLLVLETAKMPHGRNIFRVVSCSYLRPASVPKTFNLIPSICGFSAASKQLRSRKTLGRCEAATEHPLP